MDARKKKFLYVFVIFLAVILISFTSLRTSPSKFSFVNRLQTPWSRSPIESIRRDCGALCDFNRPGSPGQYFNHTSAFIDCNALFKNNYIDRAHGLHPAPHAIPADLLKDFTMGFRLPVIEWYFDEQYFGNNARFPVWTSKSIANSITSAKQGRLGGTYRLVETNEFREGLKHSPGIKGGRVLVIGSENSWAEACVLEAGAREVVTLEYGRIISKHPQIKTMVPYDFRMSFLNKTLGKFDAIATFSTVGHSGLGRYGDALNPWDDIITIARAWCVTREGGSLTLGIPYGKIDYINFNAGREYSKIRVPYLVTNWKQHYKVPGKSLQHTFVFTK